MIVEKVGHETKKMLEANDFKLKDYFKEYEQIIIPLYQRGYSWEDKNMEVFIKDIYDNNNYYIGNIMALPNELNVELIDGQQRIISSFLVLCCLKNKFNLNEDFTFLDDGKKIRVETRAPSDDSRLLEFIYNDDIARRYRTRREVKEYERAYKTIIDNNIEPKILMEKLLNVIIVEIKFVQTETDAHNMFVNLNTKGKSLENVDILKSQLFKYLSFDEMHGIEYYKEGWFETINHISEKNAQRYFDNFNDVYLENNKDKKIDNVIKNVNNLQRAKEYYDNFCYDSEQINGMCRCALTVYNRSVEYLNNRYDGNVSLEVLNDYLKLLDKAKFKQFDVVLIPLLHVRNNRERLLFINNYTIIIKFIKFILMHQEIMSINKASPSQYGNDFKTIARKLFLNKDYKHIIKEFLSDNLKVHSRETILKTIEEIRIDHNNTKHAKQIIMLLEGNINVDMTIEHFVLLDEENENSMRIGNCIPVNVDEYGQLNIDNKLQRYSQNAVSEPFLRTFLEYGFNTTNYIKKINERTQKISKEYANTYKQLYDELVNE